MTDNSSVVLENRGQAYWITVNRPEKRNAINADVVAGIVKGYRDAHEDTDVRVIVLTGAGDKHSALAPICSMLAPPSHSIFQNRTSITPIC